MRYLTEIRAFFGEFRKQYRNTGSILPSSRALGRALAGEMSKVNFPRRILEVGPGTGAVTREIVDSCRFRISAISRNTIGRIATSP